MTKTFKTDLQKSCVFLMVITCKINLLKMSNFLAERDSKLYEEHKEVSKQTR